MGYKFNGRKLAKAINDKLSSQRVEVSIRYPDRTVKTTRPMSLRDAAKEIGTSAPTLSRCSRTFKPDVDTFAKLCNWLQVDPGSFF